ncbi:MAG: hypothetical protein AB1627_07005 [Chloroflexota bacterium]
MIARDERHVETLLRAAAAELAWPATPDLRAAVLGRIARDGLVPGPAASAAPAPEARTPASEAGSPAPSRPWAPPRPRRSMLHHARPLVVALLALLVLGGVAAALGFRLPGLEILRIDRVPAAGAGLDLGSPIPLADALARDQPRVRLPSALPPPDTAWELGAGERRIVTLAYRATGDQGTLAGSDLALTVMAVPGSVDERLITKLVGPGGTVEPVSVDGSPGWWIAGAPHEILVFRPDGEVGVVTSALAGDTLLFAREGTLYRIETTLGRDATIAIAESMD